MTTARQSKSEQYKQCMDLEHCLHSVYTWSLLTSPDARICVTATLRSRRRIVSRGLRFRVSNSPDDLVQAIHSLVCGLAWSSTDIGQAASDVEHYWCFLYAIVRHYFSELEISVQCAWGRAACNEVFAKVLSPSRAGTSPRPNLAWKGVNGHAGHTESVRTPLPWPWGAAGFRCSFPLPLAPGTWEGSWPVAVCGSCVRAGCDCDGGDIFEITVCQRSLALR
jgi:hypothetical protein